MIHLGNARDIVIKDCRLLNSGQNGVIVEGDIENCTIYGNLITQTMSGGVRFVGGNNRDNVIENNYVHHVGEGIYVRNSTGDVIRHNLIHDVDENGFKALYVERSTISYNDISRVGLDGTDSDAAGIYLNCTAGGPDGGHVTIDHNLLHDMVHNGYPGYPSAAIYLDMDGVYNCTISNNVHLQHPAQVRRACPRAESRRPEQHHRSRRTGSAAATDRRSRAIAAQTWRWTRRQSTITTTPTRTIIVWSSSGAVFQVSGRPDAKTFKRVDGNVYFNPRGAYSFGAIGGKDAWQGMGYDAGTKFDMRLGL